MIKMRPNKSHTSWENWLNYLTLLKEHPEMTQMPNKMTQYRKILLFEDDVALAENILYIFFHYSTLKMER